MRFLIAFLSLMFASSAGAATFRLDFDAEVFEPSNGNPAPSQTVGGSLTASFDPAADAAAALDALDLTIDGVAYTGGSFRWFSDGGFLFAGSDCDAGGCSTGTLQDGFYLVFEGLFALGAGGVGEFAYASARLDGIWFTNDVAFTVTPLPAAIVLLGAPLLGFGFAARRRG